MENWKDIPGYEGIYAVSDYGRVKRLARTSRIGRNLPERIFKPQVAKRGNYHIIGLTNLIGRKTFPIHSLVLLAFVGDRPVGNDVNHLNGIRGDNRLKNLEYCTRSENELHKRRVLLSSIGSKIRSAKLHESDIPKIRSMRENGLSQQKIAEHFGVSRRLIGGILSKARWRHVI